VELSVIQTDVLIISNNAQRGYVLLEETKPSRYHEFNQCLKENEQLNLHIDEKYGDLILNRTIKYFNFNQQRLLCTINRNQVKKKKISLSFYFILNCDIIKLSDVTLI
jgi:hypothetical protein